MKKTALILFCVVFLFLGVIPKEVYAAFTFVVTATGTGSWTVPAGVTSVQVELWGGGGGGCYFDSGGGAGAYVKKTGLSVTPGSSITYTIASGGGGGRGTAGGVGGSGYASGGNGATTGGGGGGGGSSAVVVSGTTYIASGGGGGGNSSNSNSAAFYNYGGYGGSNVGGGGGSGTAGGNSNGSFGGEGGTGGTIQTGTNGKDSSFSGGGGSSAGTSGNGHNSSSLAGANGSGGAAGGSSSGGVGTAGSGSDSGGGGGGHGTGNGGNGGQPGGGGGAGDNNSGTTGISGTGGAGELIITYTSSLLTPSSLPNATTSVAYSQVLTVTGGTAPYTWSIASGTLPLGLSLGTSNTNTTTISGTPTSFGTSNFTIHVQSSEGTITTQTYAVQVAGNTSILSPTPSATVSSTVTISASSSDIVGVTGIQFQLDGTNLGAEVTSTSSPNTYSYSWNTASSTNGAHTITAIAYDTAGNNNLSASVNVTVANAPVISNVQTSVTASTATITWTTDETADSQVQYGLTSAYGSSSTLNTTPTTTHSVLLTGLSQYATYHFRVQSSDNGYTATSFDQMVSVTPPTIPTSSLSIALPEAAAHHSVLVGNYLYVNHIAFPLVEGINVIDTRTNKVVTFIDTDVAICGWDGCGWDTDYEVLVGTNLYVISQDYNQIAVINTLTNTVTNVFNSTGITNTNGAYSGATLVGKNLYVNNPNECWAMCNWGTNPVFGIAAGNVSVINTLTNTVTATIPVGSVPEYSTLVGTNLYVNNYGYNMVSATYSPGTVSVINTLTNTVTATISVGLGPLFSTLVGTNLYVANHGANTVSVINTLTNTVTATIPVGTNPTNSILFGTNLYVINTDGTVSVINTNTNTVTATISGVGGGDSYGMSLPPVSVGSNIYINNYNGDSPGSISVINTLTNTVTATIPVGPTPSALNLVGTNLYVTNFTQGGASGSTSSVSIIDTLTNRILDVDAPILNSFSSASANGTYTTGQSVNITANFSETLGAGSTMTVTLNTGATVTLNTVSGSTLSGTYVVESGNTSVPDLNVTSITTPIVYNASGVDIGISYSVPSHPSTPGASSGNIGDTSNISIAKSYLTIPVGTNPAGVAAVGNILYVANEGANTVSAVNANTNALIATIPVGSQPYGIAYDSTTQEIYVTNSTNGTVSVIDANPSSGTYNTVTHTITVGSNPQSVVASGTLVYVTNNISNTVSVINTATHAVSSTISVGTAPTGIAVLGTNVYVANSNIQPYFNVSGSGGTVSVIDINPSDSGTYNMVTNTILVGADPQGVTALGTNVYITNTTDGTVSVIDANSNTVTHTIAMGSGPNGILASGSNIYAENFNDGTISIIASGSNTVSATIPAGSTPSGMASIGSTLYLTRFTDGELSSLNMTNGQMSSASSDATLSALTTSSGTLNETFSSGTTAYTESVASGVTSLTVTPTVEQANATVKVNDTTVTSGSPSGSTNLNVGSNVITIVVTAQDLSTNTYTITVTRAADTTPPTTTATPAGGTYGASRNITLACVDDLSGCNHTYYTTNGDTPTTGSSIYSTTPITIATNTTLKFFSTDLANNPETPKTETYVIDATYPVTDITSHPNSTTNATSATFVFSANKESTFQCKLDTGSYTSCTSPQTYISLGEGSHTFTVQATDTLSHTEPSPSSYTWNIDLTPPVLSDGSPSGTLAVNTTSTTLQLTTNETATCAYSTTTGTDYVSMTPFTATNATTHTSTISSLQNGTSYTYYVKCQDSYGNTNSDDYSINFAIAAAPSATTYYLAPLTGNDANSGTTSPWATMEHLMTASSVVVPATVVTSTNQVTFVQNVQINPTASVTITIPDNTVMSTTTNSDFTQMTATTTVSTSALPTNYTSLGTVEYGFTSTPIALSQPVTISFAVDSSYNGQTLSVYRSEDAGTTWTQITTCTVTGGICSFTTSSLSSFAVASYTAPTTVVTTTSHSSGGGYLNRIIVGCDNRTTGFSITTGQSCVGNIGTTITTTTSTISTPSTSSGQANSAQNNFGTITLKFGSKGDAVKELQKFLNKTLKLKLKVDGSFGKSTVSAVKQWQKKNGFTADGVVGEKTRGKMEM